MTGSTPVPPQSFNDDVIAEFRANHGVVTRTPFPVLLLTTTGARSGRALTSPLAFGVDAGHVFIIASKAGAPTHPAWFHNLTADPAVTVELGGGTFEARARITERAERDRLYAAVAAEIPQFREYEQATDRVIPVVVLDGVPAPS